MFWGRRRSEQAWNILLSVIPSTPGMFSRTSDCAERTEDTTLQVFLAVATLESHPRHGQSEVRAEGEGKRPRLRGLSDPPKGLFRWKDLSSLGKKSNTSYNPHKRASIWMPINHREGANTSGKEGVRHEMCKDGNSNYNWQRLWALELNENGCILLFLFAPYQSSKNREEREVYDRANCPTHT